MQKQAKWLTWAKELQAIAQTGLAYSKDRFDIERFNRIREISVDIVKEHTGLPSEKLTELFASEIGYQTPKVDVRIAVFDTGGILLVKERSDGKWTLPGGWADIDKSVSEVAEVEVMEEAAIEVDAVRIIAILDRSKQDHPVSPYSIYKIFVEAVMKSAQEFAANSETLERGFFQASELPELSDERINADQIAMCINAHKDRTLPCLFD